MIFVTSIITSAEWLKLREAADKQFPGETLARVKCYGVTR
jgi:hypothetical protein